MQLHIVSVLQCLESCIFRQLRERMVRKRAQALSVCFPEYWMCTIPLPYGVVIRKLDRTLYEHTHIAYNGVLDHPREPSFILGARVGENTFPIGISFS